MYTCIHVNEPLYVTIHVTYSGSLTLMNLEVTLTLINVEIPIIKVKLTNIKDKLFLKATDQYLSHSNKFKMAFCALYPQRNCQVITIKFYILT